MCRLPLAMLRLALTAAAIGGSLRAAAAGVMTWDGRHPVDRIEVTVAYFVPRDRAPLSDWRERVDYFCGRIRRFHEREFGGQSVLETRVVEAPFRSVRTTEQLRAGDADFIFFQTLSEVDADRQFGKGERRAYPILLVLSDINWRPLDDFFRLRPGIGKPEFEGSLSDGHHFPGAASGGARATYLSDRGVGWGLVSADGWRVPYRGTDCVVYHEGVGHAIGMPHPEPANPSVMSQGQYHGWISESWLDDAQKKKLGWMPPEKPLDRRRDLFTAFRALPAPPTPKPGEAAALQLDWPDGLVDRRLSRLRVRIQTDLFGPWVELPTPSGPSLPRTVSLGRFDRPTPVSYRVDAELTEGERIELWGYFQVRAKPDEPPVPATPAVDLATSAPTIANETDGPNARDEIDLLRLIDAKKDRVSGDWAVRDGRLESPKEYGARVEIPYAPPEEYRMTVIVEPLDEPNGLILGQRSGDQRFLVLTSFAAGATPLSALENIDGRNVGNNPTTVSQPLYAKGRLSQVVCTVRKNSVTVLVDGREIIRWQGDRSRLSLSDYWKTPRDRALFLGTYDCRFRFYRATLRPLSGDGESLPPR